MELWCRQCHSPLSLRKLELWEIKLPEQGARHKSSLGGKCPLQGSLEEPVLYHEHLGAFSPFQRKGPKLFFSLWLVETFRASPAAASCEITFSLCHLHTLCFLKRYCTIWLSKPLENVSEGSGWVTQPGLCHPEVPLWSSSKSVYLQIQYHGASI